MESQIYHAFNGRDLWLHLFSKALDSLARWWSSFLCVLQFWVSSETMWIPAIWEQSMFFSQLSDGWAARNDSSTCLFSFSNVWMNTPKSSLSVPIMLVRDRCKRFACLFVVMLVRNDMALLETWPLYALVLLVLVMGKNTMMRKTIRGQIPKNANLEKLLAHVYENVGFVFTKDDLSSIRDKLLENKVSQKVHHPWSIDEESSVRSLLPLVPVPLLPSMSLFQRRSPT